MSKLTIQTKANSVVIVGEFCNWNLDEAKRYDRKSNYKNIVINNMPKGEYKVLDCKSYFGSEVYPTDNREMPNRYFGGEYDEAIACYFK